MDERRAAFARDLTAWLQSVELEEATAIVAALLDDHVARVAHRTMRALGLLAVHGGLVDTRGAKN